MLSSGGLALESQAWHRFSSGCGGPRACHPALVLFWLWWAPGLQSGCCRRRLTRLRCAPHTQGRSALPSRRYLQLIREGAADHGLDPEYQTWLAGLKH